MPIITRLVLLFLTTVYLQYNGQIQCKQSTVTEQSPNQQPDGWVMTWRSVVILIREISAYMYLCLKQKKKEIISAISFVLHDNLFFFKFLLKAFTSLHANSRVCLIMPYQPNESSLKLYTVLLMNHTHKCCYNVVD